jgi:hypothetical protein
MIFTGIFCELLCILPCEKIFHLTRKEEFNLKKNLFPPFDAERHKEAAPGEDQGG